MLDFIEVVLDACLLVLSYNLGDFQLPLLSQNFVCLRAGLPAGHPSVISRLGISISQPSQFQSTDNCENCKKKQCFFT